MFLSIIIPTLNEESFIATTLTCLIKNQCLEDYEIIVIDSGSSDKTVEVVSKFNCRLVHHPELKGNKSKILNQGADYAVGEVLAFLDADTLVPANFDSLILDALNEHQYVGGAFHMHFDSKDLLLKGIEKANHWRYYLTKEYYGDQMVFCRREVFDDINGYPNREILESAYFCKALLKKGKLKLLKPGVITSSRRFTENTTSALHVFLSDSKIYLLDKLGKNTNQYGKEYWHWNELND